MKKLTKQTILWTLLAIPGMAVETETWAPSRPPLPPPESVTIRASDFYPTQNNGGYEANNQSLATRGGWASFRHRLSIPQGALILKVELLASEPGGTGTIGLGFGWQGADSRWRYITQISTQSSIRESPTKWVDYPRDQRINGNYAYWLDLYLGPVPPGMNPSARRFYGVRITFVQTAWL